jgi:hypothetical protein
MESDVVSSWEQKLGNCPHLEEFEYKSNPIWQVEQVMEEVVIECSEQLGIIWRQVELSEEVTKSEAQVEQVVLESEMTEYKEQCSISGTQERKSWVGTNEVSQVSHFKSEDALDLRYSRHLEMGALQARPSDVLTRGELQVSQTPGIK